MRAVMATSLDGPSSVSVHEIPEPAGRPDGVLIRVHTVGLGWPDLLQVSGAYQRVKRTPFVVGIDCAGVVVDAPPDSELNPGDRVACVSTDGVGAELISVPPDNVLPLPDRFTFEQAAALPMNYLTAELALNERGGVKPGHVVVVHGAAGGLGSAGVQVAKAMGAFVIAVVSSDERREVAQRLGADSVVLSDGFLENVREISGPGGVDLVFDMVGEPVFRDSLRCLRPGGRLMALGFAAGVPTMTTNVLLVKNIDVRGVVWGDYVLGTPGALQKQWHRLMSLAERGAISPLIGSVRPVEQAGAVLAELADRSLWGKAVLQF